VLSLRASQEELHSAAQTDPLTGLRNRRRLLADLGKRLKVASTDRPLLLALFDLDGFKSYNDNYGHLAGDALLVRLASRLGESIEDRGAAYRMGGDEFCVLAWLDGQNEERLLPAVVAALRERGEGFSVTASYGSILLPTETADPAEALRAAEQRMQASKSLTRGAAGRQTRDVLVQVLAERSPDLGEHLDDVAIFCGLVAERLGIAEEERATLLRAASLHDIGKAAIPDAILD
jgi:two-component system cell cycle response regulator